jgi:acetamidase/formamidase
MIPRLVAALTLVSVAAFSQPAQLSGESGGGLRLDVAGDWQTTARRLGATQYMILNLVQDGEKITGTFGGLKIECALRNNVCEGDLRRGTNPPNGKIKLTVKGSEILGEGTDQDVPVTFVARRPPAPPAGGPQTRQFTPTQFHNYFSSKIEPALHIHPGDTVETKSVDAGGTDENGKRRAPGGNPLTGPFYVEGAWPGDTLVVKLNRLRLNRDTAESGDQIAGSALNPGYYRNQKMDNDFSGSWTLDRDAGVARPAKPSEHLKNYTVPLKPMLGCIGVAPPMEQSYRSGMLGGWGGNMDYREFGEGVTLYFGVNHPGALLFLGDGHAAQGAGELTGDALETSMEFSFTVELIKGKGLGMPRAENAEYRMASGIANSLPEALQAATTNLSQWLANDFKLSPNEIALVLGTAIRYEVAEVVDPMVHVVAKIEKKSLAGLAP